VLRLDVTLLFMCQFAAIADCPLPIALIMSRTGPMSEISCCSQFEAS
jgi:hypothetical protein